MFHLLKLNIMKIGTYLNFDGSQGSHFLIFPATINSYFSHLTFEIIIIPIFIFIIMVLFITKIIMIFVSQKMFFYISRTDPLDGVSFEIEPVNELNCPNCQSLNEKGSIYCSNCGHKIF